MPPLKIDKMPGTLPKEPTILFREMLRRKSEHRLIASIRNRAMRINKIVLIQTPIVRLHKKMPSGNKPALMPIKIASAEVDLAGALAEVDLVAVTWAVLDVNLLKVFK